MKRKQTRGNKSNKHNKELPFYRAEKVLITCISFHSTFTRKPYLEEEKLLQIGRDKSVLELNCTLLN